MRRIVIAGAGGRDFHNFNVAYRDDQGTYVVAFTAAQIPGIDHRRYPSALAGPRYPEGIPIRPESELEDIIGSERVDEVVLSYSDLSHADVGHVASRVLAAGADFVLRGPRTTSLKSAKPVVAVLATRTGCGKSPTSRRVAQILSGAGLRVALVRHPMPYGDLESMRVQRFASIADIDASVPTIEEREEYEEPVRQGMVVFAGVDYEAILRQAESEADVIVWDGGNNDFAFYVPDLIITVADALRPGHELGYHPGETNFRMADVIIINKVDSARQEEVAAIEANAHRVNPTARVVRAESPVDLDDGPSLVSRRVLVIEDGPTLTHGGMPFGAGTVAARKAGATTLVDPRSHATGSVAEAFRRYPHIGPVLPALGYGTQQLQELAATVRATACEVVVTGTPIDLARLIDLGRPVRHARYRLREVGHPDLVDLLGPHIEEWRERGRP